eukprot:CAMPEP_0119046092 /NCGR_PEP_ID=MMETSP1177-20130426/44335_1 /TAXON_ID=2985 /ORGANISM="Ochromonas sp, Strain CCMP1899" /LENGTH=252 /DNA_ID=CAMNT_0007018753 /DNA_START=101 /DNA_END=859 /DNA_ORIENTATION=-
MFDPSKAVVEKAKKAQKKKIIGDLVEWCLTIIPIQLKEGLLVDVKEVICGDPECAPIDTMVTIVWTAGGRGMFSMPMAPDEITQDELMDNFPDDDTLTKWFNHELAPWPPQPILRFELGARVECRIGPHAVKGWAPGRVIKHYYSEPNWPPNMTAPYQIALHDGRLIFAPSDEDGVIRLRSPAVEGAPDSPEFQIPRQGADGDDLDDDDEEDGDFVAEEDDDGVEMTHDEEEGDEDDDDDNENESNNKKTEK